MSCVAVVLGGVYTAHACFEVCGGKERARTQHFTL